MRWNVGHRMVVRHGLAALAIVSMVFGQVALADAAQGTPAPGTPVPGQFIEGDDVGLRATSYAEDIDALVATGAEQVDIVAVADAASTPFIDGATCEKEFAEEPMDPDVAYATTLCWTSDHWAQGIAGSGESHWEAVSERNLLTVSWHSEGGDETGSLTVVDVETGKYARIPLVSADFSPLVTHAGGLAWAGDRLYMADTDAMYAFDLDQFFRDPADGDVKLVASEKWEVTNSAFRISTLSLAWKTGTASLVAANYSSTVGSTVNVYQWLLDAEYRPVLDENDMARSDVHFAVRGVSHVQGVELIGPTYLFTESGGDTLITVNTEASKMSQYTFPHYNTQDLYWDETRDVIWSITEGPATERDDAPLAAGQTDRLNHESWMTYLFAFTLPNE